MIIYKDYIEYNVLGQTVNIFVNETVYGKHVVAEIDNIYYHLGNSNADIDQAIFAWQKINNKILTTDQILNIQNASCQIP